MARIKPTEEAVRMAALPGYIQRIKTNKTLAQLLEEVAESGWLVNNLFQVGGGMWRANLRFVMEDRNGIRTYFHEYADAATAEEAMAAAIWNMRQKRNDATRGASAVVFNYSNSVLIAMRENEIEQARLNSALRPWLAAERDGYT